MKIYTSKLISFVIWFHRINGVTFGGVSFNEKGTLIKSKFWSKFGYFGCLFHFIMSIIIIAITHKKDSFENLRRLTIIKTLLYIWEHLRILMMMSISIINQKYGFDIINILITYSQTKFNKLRTIAMIWLIHVIISIIIFFMSFSTKFNLSNILFGFIMSYYHDILFISMMYSISSIS